MEDAPFRTYGHEKRHQQRADHAAEDDRGHRTRERKSRLHGRAGDEGGGHHVGSREDQKKVKGRLRLLILGNRFEVGGVHGGKVAEASALGGETVRWDQYFAASPEL